jgi:hypothetical protein
VEVEKNLLTTAHGLAAVQELLFEEAEAVCSADHSLRRRAGMVRACTENLFEQFSISLQEQIEAAGDAPLIATLQ